MPYTIIIHPIQAPQVAADAGIEPRRLRASLILTFALPALLECKVFHKLLGQELSSYSLKLNRHVTYPVQETPCCPLPCLAPS